MAEEEETAQNPNFLQIHQSPSSFLEIDCRSSGKVRRFSVGTEAGFAVQCINEKLVNGVPLASYIEAVREGEEPITFGPNSILIDYGDGWKLQTVIKEGFDGQRDLDEPFKEFPGVVIESIRDDVQSATNIEFRLQDTVPVEEENKAITSEHVSDIESQSLEKLDFTDTFTTDAIFNSRDELIQWTRETGRSVGMVVIIKKSEFGASGRTSRIFFACERFGKRREYKRASKDAPTRRRVSKRCGCPFLLRGVKLPKDDQWKVKVQCGRHNHPLGRHLQGSSVAGKLTPDEKEIVKQMLRAGLKPKDILKALKERDGRNESTIRTIYNAQAKMRLEEGSAISQCNESAYHPICLNQDEARQDEVMSQCNESMFHDLCSGQDEMRLDEVLSQCDDSTMHAICNAKSEPRQDEGISQCNSS